jgi:hypothetical protein
MMVKIKRNKLDAKLPEKSSIDVQLHERVLISSNQKAVEAASPLDDQNQNRYNKIGSLEVHAIYPEGGLGSWLVVCGSFCGILASFGFMNSRKY